jgi:hypothetical protein
MREEGPLALVTSFIVHILVRPAYSPLHLSHCTSPSMVCAVSVFIAVLFVASPAFAQNTTIPIVVPDDAKPLSQNLLGFSLEQDRWPDWAGTQSRNEFTHSALLNYARLTGKPPKIRVGANSEDHTVWSPTVTVSDFASSFVCNAVHTISLI